MDRKVEILDLSNLWRDFYYKEITRKNKIFLHHTAGYDVFSAEKWLRMSSSKSFRDSGYFVGVHYFIGKNGIILKCIPEENWAWHSGTGLVEIDKSSIAIEIDNLGFMKQVSKDYLEDIYNNRFYITGIQGDIIKAKINNFEFEFKKLDYKWRGYDIYNIYSKESVESLFYLMEQLFSRHSIDKKICKREKFFPEDASYSDAKSFIGFSGIVTHVQFLGKTKKWDLSPVFPYEEMVKRFNLVQV
jgi:N-acetyl-anhydromuramyl-L-alanine amidase AmpD